MPKGDGTGPQGQAPIKARGRGRCNPKVGSTTPQGQGGIGSGRRGGQGKGRGAGQGSGRGGGKRS